MEKFNDWFLALCGALGSIGAWIVKRLYSRIDDLTDRVDEVEKKILTKEDLAQVNQTTNMILEHLLSHRATEQDDD
tara:strand:+ start:137 stop:364 length:228 start_codon:yes stop_codon:yes gene_type:complete